MVLIHFKPFWFCSMVPSHSAMLLVDGVWEVAPSACHTFIIFVSFNVFGCITHFSIYIPHSSIFTNHPSIYITHFSAYITHSSIYITHVLHIHHPFPAAFR
jgi:hypothetical protein